MLKDVLNSCRRVADHSRDVAIDMPAVSALAEKLVPRLPKVMRHTPHHLVGQGEDTVAYFLVLDALNFGSGFFEHLRPYEGQEGYFAVASALRDWFVRDGTPTSARLKSISPSDICQILGQSPGLPQTEPLFQWFATALHQCGAFLEDRLQGKYRNLLEYGNFSASGIVDLLVEMPMFRDVPVLDGLPVYILKRAQIFVHDFSIAADEEGYRQLSHLDDLTLFSDNMIPYVLENHKVLSYAPELAHRIATEALQPGERAEVEIRANAVWAGELLCRELRSLGHEVSAGGLDYALWNLGNDLRGTVTRPHICYTPYY